MFDVIYLISTQYASDEIGNQIESEIETMTYCEQANITQSEFYNSRQYDLKIKHCVKINALDYYGQAYARYKGNRYTIVRTYMKADDALELYLAEN